MRMKTFLRVTAAVLGHMVLMAIVGVSAWLLLFGYHEKQAAVAEKRRELARVQQQVDRDVETNEGLQRNIQYLNTDAGVEKVARERLDLMKPGETLFRVTTPH